MAAPSRPRSAARGRDPWAVGVAHLRSVDSRMAVLIDRVGPCDLRPRRDRFGSLVRSIVGQQISTKAAQAINARLLERIGGAYRPEALLALSPEAMQAAGVSRTKAAYLRNLAEAVHGGHIPIHAFGRWSDDAIIARLTTVKGIGVWTAEMFLMFALNRPDVLPVGDLGIRDGLRRWHGLADVPAPKHCHALAEPWRPHRTLACWYLWRSRDTGVGVD